MQLHHAKILHCNNRAFDSKRKKDINIEKGVEWNDFTIK